MKYGFVMGERKNQLSFLQILIIMTIIILIKIIITNTI